MRARDNAHEQASALEACGGEAEEEARARAQRSHLARTPRSLLLCASRHSRGHEEDLARYWSGYIEKHHLSSSLSLSHATTLSSSPPANRRTHGPSCLRPSSSAAQLPGHSGELVVVGERRGELDDVGEDGGGEGGEARARMEGPGRRRWCLSEHGVRARRLCHGVWWLWR